ncbi:hypothetical protein ACWDG9_36305 [Streptomyces sp. NPDC001073]
MSKFPLKNGRRPGHRKSRWRVIPATQTPPPRAAPAQDHLPVRDPQAALSALLPDFPDKSAPVNLFGVAAGEVTNPAFDLKRLRRVRCTDAPPENTP